MPRDVGGQSPLRNIQGPRQNFAGSGMAKSKGVLEELAMGARKSEAAWGLLRARGIELITKSVAGTPFRPGPGCGAPGKINENRVRARRTQSETSPAVACGVRADETLGQKVIGHRVAILRRRHDRGLRFRCDFGSGGSANAALALLDQPARDHGVGVLVEPLIEQGRNFLAEIGGVGEARELVRLQGVAGSGEEELPGRLGALIDHVRLQYVGSNVLRVYSTTENSMVTSNREVYTLWKSVEIEENVVVACSGCAGDYEDPDRTAWEGEFEEEEAEEAGDEPGSDA